MTGGLDRAALIDAAARALYERHKFGGWDRAGDFNRGVYRMDAERAVDAVLPLIAKAILATPFPTTSDPTLYREGYEDGIGDAVELVRSFGAQS